METALPLAVADHGSGEAVFVLIHGFGGSSYSWRFWIPALERRGRVLTVDLKGFGASPHPDDDAYGPKDQASLVEALLVELDLRHVTLIGHSLGGAVSLLVALGQRGSGRVERLVLVAAPAYRQRLPPVVTLSRHPRASRWLLRAVGAERVVRWTLRSIVYDPASVTDDQVREYARGLRTPGGLRGTLAAGRALLPDDIEELSRRWSDLDVSTLLIWGDSDRVIPLWVGERLAKELPDARLIVHESCGHVPQEECPDETWRSVARFLDETRASDSSA